MSVSKGSRFAEYLVRTGHYLRQQVLSLRARPSWQKSQQWFTFTDVDDLNEFKIGSDADIGGHSRCYWGLTDRQTALFWGTLSSNADVKTLKSGYAGLTSKWRPKTALHQPGFDIKPFRYLEVEAKGDHHTWFVNVMTGEPGMPVKMWQQRVNFKTPGQFETIHLDLANFVRTLGSEVHPRAPKMGTFVTQVGMSIMHQPGDFALELRSIRAVNSIRSWGYTDTMLVDEYIDEEGRHRKATAQRLNNEGKQGAERDDKLDVMFGPLFQDPEQHATDAKNEEQGRNDIVDDDLARLVFGKTPKDNNK